MENTNYTRQRHTHKSSSRSNSPSRAVPYRTHHHHHHHHQPLLSSRWQQLVVGAGSAAGTTAAVISEESMKCLKYCLSWLQYAIQHIEQQMMTLKNYLVSLANKSTTNNSLAPNTNQKSILSDIKKDIVETLRKVVEVITRYAGVSLPTQARQTVRGFILNLPGKWATLNDIRSTNTSPACSPMLAPRQLNKIDPKQEEATIKLLSFGQESVEMLHSVSSVFSDTVDRAELWIDRLKMVPGMNKSTTSNNNNNNNNDITLNGESVRLPPIRNLDNSYDHQQKLKLDL